MYRKLIDENLVNFPLEKRVPVGDLIIDVPLKYKCRAVNLVFPISSSAARKVTNSDKLRSFEIWPGKSLLCVTIFDFISGPVGAYTEITLSIPVNRSLINIPIISLFLAKFFNRIGYFVFSVAQSKKIAIEHGVAITGYPRYSLTELIDVNFSEDKKSIEIYSEGDNKKILSFSISKPKKEKFIREQYSTYYRKKDDLFHILMRSLGYMGKSKIHNFSLGNHGMAQIINNLGIIPHAIDVRLYSEIVKIIHFPSKYQE